MKSACVYGKIREEPNGLINKHYNKGEMIMRISPLQKARYEYTPKLPGMLRNGIAEISVKEGEATQSVADPGEDCRAFP